MSENKTKDLPKPDEAGSGKDEKKKQQRPGFRKPYAAPKFKGKDNNLEGYVYDMIGSKQSQAEAFM